MRPIDADVHVEYFEGLARSLANARCFGAADAIQGAAEKLKSAPALDVVAVTRCKDCKHSAIDAYSERRMCVRNGGIKPNGHIWFGTAVQDDHFCGYAEPRGEEDKQS